MKTKWTTEKPTEPGLYWAYEDLDPRDSDVMLVRLDEGDELFYMVMYDMAFKANHFCYFMPFVYPPPPED